MMKIKVFIMIGLLLLSSFFLTGCWGKVEVEDLGFVMAIGVDLGKEPGAYRITYQMALPKKGGDSGGSMQNLTFTIEAKSMRESLEKAYAMSSRRPFVGTVKVVVIGNDVAQSGINAFLDFFQRYNEFRRTTYLVLSKGKAEDLLNVETKGDKFPAMSIQAAIDQDKEISDFPVVRLGHYLTLLADGDTAPVIPLAYPIKPGEEGIDYKSQDPNKAQEIHMAGAGVFNGDRLVDVLSPDETKGYMWLQNLVKFKFLSVSLGQDKHYFASGRVISASTKWRIVQNNGVYSIQYGIKAAVSIDEFSGSQIRRTPAEWLNMAYTTIEPAFEEEIRKECMASLEKSRSLKLDYLGIGRHIEEQEAGYWKEIKDHWQDELPNFPVDLNVTVNLENAGASFNPPTNSPGTGQQ